MKKITLDTTLEEFSDYLLNDLIYDSLPKIGNSYKKFNTYFLYLSICNHEIFLKSNEKENDIHNDFNLFRDSKETNDKPNPGHFHHIINNNNGVNLFSKTLGIHNNIAKRESKNLVKDCDNLKSLIHKIETSNELNSKFKNYVSDYIKPIFEDELIIESEEDAMNSLDQKSLFTQLEELIQKDVKQIIVTGPPGTGKTYIAQKIAGSLGAKIEFNNFVQFHPSFDYVDFIEGIRPFENANHEMIFRKTDGIFKSFCRHVAELNKNEGNQSKKYFFIIDEINRADLSKVFGELLFALEEDKRGQRISTQYSQLPTYYYNEEANNTATYEEDIFKEGFFVPENIFILATMNDIDRSVEQIDFAFRRRFKWIQVNVEEQSLRDAFESGEFVDNKHINGVIEAITQLNEFIKENGKEFQLNENYFISQGYFKNLNKQDISDLNKVLKHAWDIRIKLTIAEYVRGEINAEAFLEQAKNAFFSPISSTDQIGS